MRMYLTSYPPHPPDRHDRAPYGVSSGGGVCVCVCGWSFLEEPRRVVPGGGGDDDDDMYIGVRGEQLSIESIYRRD